AQGKSLINQEFVALAGFNTKYAKREDINEYLRITSTIPIDVFIHLLEDFVKYDASHWLHEVKCPTLILAGERDLITPPRNQRIFHQLIPGSDLHLIPEGSHCPQMEKPDLVNGILEKFFRSLERANPKQRRSAKLAQKH